MNRDKETNIVADDEISLRDVYLLLLDARYKIIIFTAACIIASLLVSLLMPKIYVAKASLSLTMNVNSNNGTGLGAQLLSNLPSLSGLAQGFNSLLDMTTLSANRDAIDPQTSYKASFDPKNGLINLVANGETAEDSLKNINKLVKTAKSYFNDRVTAAIITNIDAMLIRSELDSSNLQANLRLLQKILGTTNSQTRILQPNPPITNLDGALTTQNSSVSYTTLNVQNTTLRTSLAQSQALIEALEQLKTRPADLEKLAGQALQLQILAPPASPLRADQPRPLLYMVLSGIAGLLLSIVWVFINEALRPPHPVTLERQKTRSKNSLLLDT